MVSDLIADLLTRIKNATQRNAREIKLPSSKMLIAIANILKEQEFVEEVEVITAEGEAFPQLVLKFKFIDGKPAISHVERVSKPGLRRYVSYKDLKPVLSGL